MSRVVEGRDADKTIVAQSETTDPQLELESQIGLIG
jgi:hypothetical protein